MKLRTTGTCLKATLLRNPIIFWYMFHPLHKPVCIGFSDDFFYYYYIFRSHLTSQCISIVIVILIIVISSASCPIFLSNILVLYVIFPEILNKYHHYPHHHHHILEIQRYKGGFGEKKIWTSEQVLTIIKIIIPISNSRMIMKYADDYVEHMQCVIRWNR